jgi:predicted DNA-binding transcriptional regulator YafY
MRTDKIKRLKKFVAEMRRNRYPNAKSFAALWTEEEDFDGFDGAAVSVKTIRRDIRTLKVDFGAPMAFDRARNGYFLRDKSWEFGMPILGDSYTMASVIGAKVAADIFPEPVRGEISAAVDDILSTNNSDFLNNSDIASLLVAPGMNVKIEPAVFKTVFAAWRDRRALKVTHRNAMGRQRDFRLHPHALFYSGGAWYIKGREPDREDDWNGNYAVHRIISAEITGDDQFKPDLELIKEAREGRLFCFEETENAEVWCSPETAPYIRERIRKGETVSERPDGSLIIKIPRIHTRELTAWILSDGGGSKLLNPPALAAEIKDLALKVAGAH